MIFFPYHSSTKKFREISSVLSAGKMAANKDAGDYCCSLFKLKR